MLFELRRKFIRWAQDLTALPDIELDPRLENRKGDNWYWLFRIAEEAGGEWPARALAAAISADDERAADQNEVTALLAAIWEVFATRGVVRIETQALVDDLLKADEGRWQEAHRGKPITQYYLRECLKMVIPRTEEMNKARQWKEVARPGAAMPRTTSRMRGDAIWADRSPQLHKRTCMPKGRSQHPATSATSGDRR